jgi:hypothetical protein
MQIESNALQRRFGRAKDVEARADDFRADAIAAENRYAICLHSLVIFTKNP